VYVYLLIYTCLYICTQTHTHTLSHTYIRVPGTANRPLYECTARGEATLDPAPPCTMYASVSTRACTRTHIHAHTHARTHARIHAHIQTHIHTHTRDARPSTHARTLAHSRARTLARALLALTHTSGPGAREEWGLPEWAEECEFSAAANASSALLVVTCNENPYYSLCREHIL
jgi:hypothetical protein